MATITTTSEEVPAVVSAVERMFGVDLGAVRRILGIDHGAQVSGSVTWIDPLDGGKKLVLTVNITTAQTSTVAGK